MTAEATSDQDWILTPEIIETKLTAYQSAAITHLAFWFPLALDTLGVEYSRQDSPTLKRLLASSFSSLSHLPEAVLIKHQAILLDTLHCFFALGDYSATHLSVAKKYYQCLNKTPQLENMDILFFWQLLHGNTNRSVNLKANYSKMLSTVDQNTIALHQFKAICALQERNSEQLNQALSEYHYCRSQWLEHSIYRRDKFDFFTESIVHFKAYMKTT